MSTAQKILVKGFGECSIELQDYNTLLLVLPMDGPWEELEERLCSYTEIEKKGIDPIEEDAVGELLYGAVYYHLLHSRGPIAVKFRVVSGVESYALYSTSCSSISRLQCAAMELEERFFVEYWSPPVDTILTEGVQQHVATFFKEEFQKAVNDGRFDSLPEGAAVAPPSINVFSAKKGNTVSWFLSQSRAKKALDA